MSTQEYIRSITANEFPILTPLPEVSQMSSNSSFFANVSWQTWLIIFLILTLLGINIFAYLAKGTEETASIFKKVFGPILAFFGFSTLETAKKTVETSATGAKAGVDIVAGTTTGAIDIVEDIATPRPTSGTSVGMSGPQGQFATSSLPVVKANSNIDEWQQGSLEKALEDSSSRQNKGPLPSESSLTTGKAGWCFIGEEQGLRTCSEIGVNDMCMSGDVFPTQAVCMNPNLRA
jgi:hypothetical protein